MFMIILHKTKSFNCSGKFYVHIKYIMFNSINPKHKRYRNNCNTCVVIEIRKKKKINIIIIHFDTQF